MRGVGGTMVGLETLLNSESPPKSPHCSTIMLDASVEPDVSAHEWVEIAGSMP